MTRALVMPKSGTDFAILLIFWAESEIDRYRVEVTIRNTATTRRSLDFGPGKSIEFGQGLESISFATSGDVSTAPFVGTAIAFAMGQGQLDWAFCAAGILMSTGVWLHVTERHEHLHIHAPLEHEHLHYHDEHHQHEHSPFDPPGEPHAHRHKHARLAHSHPHYPDIHHHHDH